LADGPISTNIVPGTVSERPKVQLSKSCVGESPPWVQIPPVPPEKRPGSQQLQGIRGVCRCHVAAHPPSTHLVDDLADRVDHELRVAELDVVVTPSRGDVHSLVELRG
jgi:hypothetical protein